MITKGNLISHGTKTHNGKAFVFEMLNGSDNWDKALPLSLDDDNWEEMMVMQREIIKRYNAVPDMIEALERVLPRFTMMAIQLPVEQHDDARETIVLIHDALIKAGIK